VTTVAQAQEESDAADAQTVPDVGDGPPQATGRAFCAGRTGLAGFGRVGLVESRDPGLCLALSVGYGFLEEHEGDSGTHQRIAGALSAGAYLLDWLALSLGFVGHYDSHPDDAFGSDETGVGIPRLAARMGSELSPGLSLGAELGVAFPGESAPSIAFAAISPELLLLASYALAETGLTLGLSLGGRLDRSTEAVDDPTTYRHGDLISIGVSDSNAVLVGAAASYRTGDMDLFGELTWDILVGSESPGATDGPIRLGAGFRYLVIPEAAAELLAELRLNGVPEATGALVPVEPRFTIVAGFRYWLSFGEEPAVEDEPDHGSGGVTQAGVEHTARVRGRVLDDAGEPVTDARVELRVGEEMRESTTDAEGWYEFDDVPTGTAQVRVESEGFGVMDLAIRVPPAEPPQHRLEVLPGQLRGLVRSYRGEPLRATVSVSPGDVSTETDEEGMFEIDLPPGDYEVAVEAPRYAGQTRNITIERNGVTVLNVDLRRGRR
jgi:hypothetical protein